MVSGDAADLGVHGDVGVAARLTAPDLAGHYVIHGPYIVQTGIGEAVMAKRAKRPRRARKLGTLDDVLAKEGKREKFEAVAVKEVLAWQIGEAMKARKLSRQGLAQRMNTSRSQVRRLLDPKDGNVTLATLQRAAKIVGRSLRLELV